jgi:ribosome maturation factor RimP
VAILGRETTDLHDFEVGSPPTFFFEGPREPERRVTMDAETLVRPVIEGAGLELVDVSFGREGGRRILRLTVDRDGGVDLDTISTISEKVSRRLDVEGFDAGPYALEVTSPGVERPLRRPQDFRRAVGELIRAKTAEGVVEGVLRSADEHQVVIEADGEERRLPLDAVTAAKTMVDWEAELRGGAR